MHSEAAQKGGDLCEQEVRMTCANPNAPVVVDLVKLYQISWGTWPEYLTISGEERRVGFELELSAAHEPGTGHLGPGCPACRHTYEALRAVADRILPAPERSSMCRVCPYGQALRYSKASGSRPDVVLRLKVLHEGGPERVKGQCELRCMKLMEATLAELGACRQRWSLFETKAWREGNNVARG